MAYEDHQRGTANALSQVGTQGGATLLVALKSLEELNSLLSETTVTAANLADALCGSVPTETAAKGEAVARSPNGLADQIVTAVAAATQQTHRLRQHLGRADSRIS